MGQRPLVLKPLRLLDRVELFVVGEDLAEQGAADFGRVSDLVYLIGEVLLEREELA